MGVVVQSNNQSINLQVDSDTATVEIHTTVQSSNIELGSVGGVTVNNYGGSSYPHIQVASATDWTANHNLGRKITAAYIEDSGGTTWQALKITNTDLNNTTVKVGNVPFSGTMNLT
jgi:hypothetical protein